MTSNLPVFTLRINKNLMDKIRSISERNKRSTNREIEFVLEQYVSKFEKYNGKIKHI